MMWRWILAALFIFSFCTGTGYIIIPFSIGVAGLVPGLIAILLSWIYLLFTGFYYLEATLASPEGANVFSISQRYIGHTWAWISSLILLFVVYSNMISFFFGAGLIVSPLLANAHIHLSATTLIILLGIVVGISIYLGVTFTMHFNFLFAVLTGIIFYLCFKAGLHTTSHKTLAESEWAFIVLAIPSIVNTLYFQTLIPSIASFLNYNRKSVQSCIAIGFTLAVAVLVVWLFFFLAPKSKSHELSLSQINPNDLDYNVLIKVPHIGKWLPYLLGTSFITSILCNLIILVDFFTDAFHVVFQKQSKLKRLFPCVCALIPGVLISLIPSQNLFALELYVAEIGGAFLAGLLPIIWVWHLRYVAHEKIHELAPGGKSMLIVLTAFTLFIFYSVAIEIFYQRTS